MLIVATGNNEYVERRVAADVRSVNPFRKALNHLAIYRGMASLVELFRDTEFLDQGACPWLTR